MTSEYITSQQLQLLLGYLTEPNKLACRVAAETGLRIGDVLALTTDQIRACRRSRSILVQESKTGKERRISLSPGLVREILAQAGEIWAWPNRLDSARHRTRQAVWADVRRAAVAAGLEQHVSPHSFRKLYADQIYQRSHSLKAVQQALHHSKAETTRGYLRAAEEYRRTHRRRL